MKWPITVLITIASYHLVQSAAEAQLIQVRPGYIKAPFVRVHKYADGSSYVRAPFLSVDSTGRGAYHHPHLIPRHQFHQMSWDSLCRTICDATDELTRQLSTFPTGAYWCNYLVTVELQDLLHHGSRRPLTLEERQRAEEILLIYESVYATRELSAIVSLSGFQTVHIALHELLLTDEQRLRRELCYAADNLAESLSRLRDGQQWRDYLALGFSHEDDRVPARDHVASVQQRYESLQQHDVITQLPGFKETRDLLGRYLQQLEEHQPIQKPTVEKLPTPAPPTVE